MDDIKICLVDSIDNKNIPLVQSDLYSNWLDNKHFKVLLTDKGKEILFGLFILHKISFNQKILYCPKGPVWLSDKKTDKYRNIFIDKVKKIAKENNVMFVRLQTQDKFKGILNKSGFKDTKIIQPKNEWIIDVPKDIDKWLSDQKQTTRYAINKAIKAGVNIKIIENSSDGFKNFYSLMKNMTERKNIKLHSREYFERAFNTENSFVVEAWVKDKIVASLFITINNKRADYVFGASDSNKNNATYLAHFELLKYLIKLGCKEYSMGGIADNEYSVFKRKFLGKIEKHDRLIDIPINLFKYIIYFIYKII